MRRKREEGIKDHTLDLHFWSQTPHLDDHVHSPVRSSAGALPDGPMAGGTQEVPTSLRTPSRRGKDPNRNINDRYDTWFNSV